jgi:hypothetical protein
VSALVQQAVLVTASLPQQVLLRQVVLNIWLLVVVAAVDQMVVVVVARELLELHQDLRYLRAHPLL